MQNCLPIVIGLRYLRSKRSNSFISFVSLFALVGMALGVLALTIVLSVMNGFDYELKERILRAVPHGFIEPEQGMADPESLMGLLHGSDGLQGVAPFVQTSGLLTFDGSARGVEIVGVDPVFEPSVSEFHSYMTAGSMNSLRAGQYRVLMGGLLARYLGVGVGDKVTLTLPEVSITPAGVFPRTRQFTVSGVYETNSQGDQHRIVIHITDGQKLLRLGDKVQGLRVKTDDIYRAPQILKELAEKLNLPDPVGLKDWSQTQGHLFEAVKMEKTIVGFLLGIIVAVAAFNIITSLIMMIAEKRGDIAVLRTMGLSARGIVAVFMVQGLTLGIVGVAVGAVLGIAGAFGVSSIVAWLEQMLGLQVFDPSVYFVTHLPSEWHWQDSVFICAGALVVSFLASAYPAYRASQIPPAEALRYNS